MRLVRFRFGDRIATGAIDAGSDDIRILRGTFFEDPIPTGEQVPLDDVRLLAPVLPSKLVCVGKNYAAHAAEFGMEVPEEPLLFLKPSTAVIGPGDPIELLPISKRVDYEGELAVVIGRLARRVRAEDAYRYILGYTCANDVTLRDLQHTNDQWARAKGFDGSCPLGPWIETVLDPNDIRIETRLNGEIRQAAQTSDMVFGVAELIEYITEFMTLLPGDVLLTGTPEGESGDSPAVTSSRSRSTASARSRTPWWRSGRPGPLPVRARAQRFDPRRQRAVGALQLVVRAASRRGVRAPGRGHGHQPGERGGVPRRGGVAAMARSRLGRGARRRRSVGPYRQSATDRYLPRDRRAADRRRQRVPLRYCTAEELKGTQQAAKDRGAASRGDDGRCLRLTDAERGAFEREGRPFTVRFAMPDREWVVDDLVKGEVRFPAGQLRDFVLVRSDGSPVFLLAVAVDDMLMGITHVIRGDDLLASAPRNAAVIEALGGTPPRYAHLPQVLGMDGKPLSKRHGSTSVEAFREQGFLPEALMNYLALLGWSKDESTTFLSRDELVEAFDLSRVSSNPAAFDTKKLEWMNNHYIQSLDDDELAARCVHFLTEAGLLPDPATLRAAMPIVRERMKTLTESATLLRFLFTDDVVPDEKARDTIAKAPPGYLAKVADALEVLEPWEHTAIMATLDAVGTAEGLNRSKAFEPVRAAVTGSRVSPPLPESLELLGREPTVARLRAAAA